MGEPHDYHSFLHRFNSNVTAPRCDMETGLGLPCPFCGAVYFTAIPIFTATVQLVQTCRRCHRSGYFVFEYTNEQAFQSRTFYVVQTGGPKQPSWFYPRVGWVN